MRIGYYLVLLVDYRLPVESVLILCNVGWLIFFVLEAFKQTHAVIPKTTQDLLDFFQASLP